MAGGTASGLASDNAGHLGYNWNNMAADYGWNSGLSPAANQWSMAALVIAPSSATVYIFGASGIQSNSIANTHTNRAFTGGPTLIGADNNTLPGRIFNGMIDDVSVLPGACLPDSPANLHVAAVGDYPVIATQPQSKTV